MTTTISLIEYNKLLASHAELTEIRKREAKIAEDKFKKAKRNYELNEKTRYSNYKLDVAYLEKKLLPQPPDRYDWDIAGANTKTNAEITEFKKRFNRRKKARENSFYKRYAEETIIPYEY